MLGQLLTGADVGDIAHAGAADLFGIGDAHHAHIGQLVPGLLGETLGLVDLSGDGGDFLQAEVMQHVQNVLLVLIEVEIHTKSLPFFMIIPNRGNDS